MARSRAGAVAGREQSVPALPRPHQPDHAAPPLWRPRRSTHGRARGRGVRAGRGRHAFHRRAGAVLLAIAPGLSAGRRVHGAIHAGRGRALPRHPAQLGRACARALRARARAGRGRTPACRRRHPGGHGAVRRSHRRRPRAGARARRGPGVRVHGPLLRRARTRADRPHVPRGRLSRLPPLGRPGQAALARGAPSLARTPPRRHPRAARPGHGLQLGRRPDARSRVRRPRLPGTLQPARPRRPARRGS